MRKTKITRMAAGVTAGLLLAASIPFTAAAREGLDSGSQEAAEQIISYKYDFLNITTDQGDLVRDHYHWEAASRTLTLQNFAAEDDSAVNGSLIRLPDQSTVILKGKNILSESAYNGSCLSAKGQLTICGKGSLKAISESSAVLAVNGELEKDKIETYNLTIRDCTLDLETYGQGSYPINGQDITVTNAKLNLVGHRCGIMAIGDIVIDHSKADITCNYDEEDLEGDIADGNTWPVIYGVNVILDHVDLHLSGDHARITGIGDMAINQSTIVDDSVDFGGSIQTVGHLTIAGTRYTISNSEKNGILGDKGLNIRGSQIQMTADPEYGGISGLMSYGDLNVEDSTIEAANYQVGVYDCMNTRLKNSTFRLTGLVNSAFRNTCGGLTADNCDLTTDQGLCAFVSEGRAPEDIYSAAPERSFLADIPVESPGAVILNKTRLTATNTSEGVFMTVGETILDGCHITAPDEVTQGQVTTTINPSVGPMTFQTFMKGGFTVKDLIIK